MSKHSFNYNLNQGKYSLKFIIYLFLLLDVMLFFSIPFEIFGDVITWELLVFGGMLIGLRVQGRYKEIVYDMIALRKDPKYNKKEDLRGHRLIRLIDRIMIDYDLYLENQNKKYEKKIKKHKKKRGDKRMLWDDIVKKQAGYSLIAILALFGVVFGFILDSTDLHWILVIALSGTWEIVDIFLFFYIHYIFNIEIPAKAPMSEPIGFKENLNTAGIPGT